MSVTSLQIIHIVDILAADLQGANNAGCKSVWLNNQAINYHYKGVAYMEISDNHELEI
ncbi:haloacid dehalogenase, partial [Pseudoalteromonas ruthenica]